MDTRIVSHFLFPAADRAQRGELKISDQDQLQRCISSAEITSNFIEIELQAFLVNFVPHMLAMNFQELFLGSSFAILQSFIRVNGISLVYKQPRV